MRLSKEERRLMREGNRYARLARQAAERGEIEIATRMNYRAVTAKHLAERHALNREAA